MDCIPSIFSKGKTIPFKHHEIDEFLDTVLDSNLGFTLSALHTMLYRTNVTWRDGSMFCKHASQYKELVFVV